MDAVVQLVRNALCCVKDLSLFPDSFLYDASHTARIYVFPSPHMDQTTPLELLISISQLYACISCTLSGYRLITTNGIWKLKQLNQLFQSQIHFFQKQDENEKKQKSDDSKNNGSGDERTDRKIISNSIVEEGNNALKSVWIGICVISIGISFFWLFANSLHVTATGWIGGLPALIHALTVMEIALVPLLYYMIQDGLSSIQKSRMMKGLAANLDVHLSQKGNDDWLTLENYTFLTSWKPFWTSGELLVFSTPEEKETKLARELLTVQKSLQDLKTNKAKKNEVASRLQSEANVAKWEGYREYLYFLFNFIAFYGYLLGIVCYYFEKEEDQPAYVSSLRFGYSNADADWAGNFAGDFMWTIEPIVVLGSPILLKRMNMYGQEKIKAD